MTGILLYDVASSRGIIILKYIFKNLNLKKGMSDWYTKKEQLRFQK